MRQALINTLTEVAESDKDIWLLTADMGFGLVEPFAERFPERYVNVGVAEQNMIGVATGLALEGKRVFCYSIGNFPTMRCLEQIRNDVCYHNLPICIVSGGAGLWYGALGMTHHAVEDIAIMRCLPNMTVASPCRTRDVGMLIKHFLDRGRPHYLRMTRTADIPDRKINNKPDVVLLATGGQLLANAILAELVLESEHGIAVRTMGWAMIKPFDHTLLLLVSTRAKLVITIEEHSRIGGLGSAVAEVLAGLKQHSPLIRLGTDDCYSTTAMSYEELLKFHKLDTGSIVQGVLDALH